MIKKKGIIVILIVLLGAVVFYGCGSNDNNKDSNMNMSNSTMDNMAK